MEKVSKEDKGKPIRVLQIGMHDKIGGVETFLMNYYKNIDKEKVQFDFINQYKKLCFSEDIEKMGGKIYNITNVKMNPFKYYYELKNVIKNNEYNIVHINMLSAANILPVIAASKCKVKNIIVHSHCNGITKGILRRVLNTVNKRIIIKNANNFFACSEEAGRWMFKNTKFEIIKNGIDVNKFLFNKKIRENIRQKLNIENKIVFGHIGRFDEEKNHELLIEIFSEIHKKNNKAILLLVGDGVLKESIQKLVIKKQLEKYVIMVGVQNNPQDYYCAFDEFIFPSKFEGLGLVAIEAQISGLNCLVSKNVPKEIDITNNVKFFDLNENASNIADYALGMLNSNNRSKINIHENYDIVSLAKNLENKYIKMSKIRIMHFVYGLVNGGVEKVLINYFSKIDKSKYDLSIVIQQNSEKKCERQFKKLGFTIYRVPEKKYIFKYFSSVNKLIKKISPDIIHSHMTEANFLPNFISKKNKVKIRISHSHSYLPKCSLKNKFFLYIGKKVSNVYFACSKEAGIYAFGKSNDVKIIYNAFDISKYCYSDNIRKIKRKENNLNGKFVLLNIGRMVEQKNQLRLLEIYKKYQLIDNNSELIIIGDGKLREKIVNKIDSLNLINNVTLINQTDDINGYMQASDCLIFPTKFEGLGITLVEAQASDLPVITSNVVPKEAKIDNNESYKLLDLKDNDNIWVKEIKKIKNKNIKRNKKINEIMNESHYNINNEYINLFNIYDELIKKKGIY